MCQGKEKRTSVFPCVRHAHKLTCLKRSTSKGYPEALEHYELSEKGDTEKVARAITREMLPMRNETCRIKNLMQSMLTRASTKRHVMLIHVSSRWGQVMARRTKSSEAASAGRDALPRNAAEQARRFSMNAFVANVAHGI